ncbi:hypothetical protein M0812_01008 [Anaeramoeba flamelloides]|uniref:Uncharacterized protein n=1 Tax=Anaeramoeba flamelloides TaxID=1746091 RepID=A0AAV8A428_9EUKA|nr:hypothetical protein M0812_01008 [Anaeramoeba flamelloides]
MSVNKENWIYQTPRNLYELYINCYCSKNVLIGSRDYVLSLAHKSWNKVKNEKQNVKEYITQALGTVTNIEEVLFKTQGGLLKAKGNQQQRNNQSQEFGSLLKLGSQTSLHFDNRVLSRKQKEERNSQFEKLFVEKFFPVSLESLSSQIKTTNFLNAFRKGSHNWGEISELFSLYSKGLKRNPQTNSLLSQKIREAEDYLKQIPILLNNLILKPNNTNILECVNTFNQFSKQTQLTKQRIRKRIYRQRAKEKETQKNNNKHQKNKGATKKKPKQKTKTKPQIKQKQKQTRVRTQKKNPKKKQGQEPRPQQEQEQTQANYKVEEKQSQKEKSQAKNRTKIKAKPQAKKKKKKKIRRVKRRQSQNKEIRTQSESKIPNKTEKTQKLKNQKIQKNKENVKQKQINLQTQNNYFRNNPLEQLFEIAKANSPQINLESIDQNYQPNENEKQNKNENETVSESEEERQKKVKKEILKKKDPRKQQMEMEKEKEKQTQKEKEKEKEMEMEIKMKKLFEKEKNTKIESENVKKAHKENNLQIQNHQISKQDVSRKRKELETVKLLTNLKSPTTQNYINEEIANQGNYNYKKFRMNDPINNNCKVPSPLPLSPNDWMYKLPNYNYSFNYNYNYNPQYPQNFKKYDNNYTNNMYKFNDQPNPFLITSPPLFYPQKELNYKLLGNFNNTNNFKNNFSKDNENKILNGNQKYNIKRRNPSENSFKNKNEFGISNVQNLNTIDYKKNNYLNKGNLDINKIKIENNDEKEQVVENKEMYGWERNKKTKKEKTEKEEEKQKRNKKENEKEKENEYDNIEFKETHENKIKIKVINQNDDVNNKKNDNIDTKTRNENINSNVNGNKKEIQNENDQDFYLLLLNLSFWDESIDYILQNNEVDFSPLSFRQLSSIFSEIYFVGVMNVKSIMERFNFDQSHKTKIETQLLYLFPIILIQQDNNSIIVNIHKFTKKAIIKSFLLLDTNSSTFLSPKLLFGSETVENDNNAMDKDNQNYSFSNNDIQNSTYTKPTPNLIKQQRQNEKDTYNGYSGNIFNQSSNTNEKSTPNLIKLKTENEFNYKDKSKKTNFIFDCSDWQINFPIRSDFLEKTPRIFQVLLKFIREESLKTEKLKRPLIKSCFQNDFHEGNHSKQGKEEEKEKGGEEEQEEEEREKEKKKEESKKAFQKDYNSKIFHNNLLLTLSKKIQSNHPLFCYSHTQIQHILEFTSKFHKECSFIIACKLCYFQIGKQVYSEYSDLKIMMELYSDSNLSNTNAYNPKKLIIPCIYSTLEFEQKKSFFQDLSKRDHYEIPQPKQFTAFVRSANYNFPTSESHANDLYQIIFGSKKKIISILVNYNDLELNPNSFFSLIYFGRLWFELQLDMLNIVSYTPNQNYYNQVPNSFKNIQTKYQKFISRNNENSNVVENGNGNGNENRGGDTMRNENDNDIEIINQDIYKFSEFLSNTNYNDTPIHSVPLKCKQKTSPWNDYDQVQSFYEQFKKNPIQNIGEQFKNIKSEYQFYLKHSNKQDYLLTFQKCKLKDCQYCVNRPIKAKKSFELLNKIPNLFTPIPSNTYPGHYQNFIEKINNIN